MKLQNKIILLTATLGILGCNSKPDYGKLGKPDKDGKGKYDIENIILTRNSSKDTSNAFVDTTLSKHQSRNFDGVYPKKIKGEGTSSKEKISFKTEYDEFSTIGALNVFKESNYTYEIQNKLSTSKNKLNKKEYTLNVYLMNKNLELYIWDTYNYVAQNSFSKDTYYLSNRYTLKTKEGKEMIKKEQTKVDEYLKFIESYKKN